MAVKDDNLFLSFADDYDRMIDWQKRLNREEPFFKKLFSANGSASALDTACGTGRHAIMFCSMGLEAGAADISQDMIDKAERNAGATGCRIEFRKAGLTEIDKVFSRNFDAVTCLGNSLPHIREEEELARAFEAVYNITSGNGIFILQIRNYRKIYERHERFMPLNTRVEGDHEYIYLRMNEIGKDFVTFNIIVMVKDNEGKWSYRVESEQLKPWFPDEIEELLKRTGFMVEGIFGDMNFSPFEPLESTDLIIIARKNR